jgi:hypothetical protein
MTPVCVFHGVDSAEILRRLDSKPARMVELDEALEAFRSHLDRRPESVRAAIARKRSAQDAEDLRRFISATAHLPDRAFGTIAKPEPFRQLCIGLGRLRRIRMTDLWHDEPARQHPRRGRDPRRRPDPLEVVEAADREGPVAEDS